MLGFDVHRDVVAAGDRGFLVALLVGCRLNFFRRGHRRNRQLLLQIVPVAHRAMRRRRVLRTDQRLEHAPATAAAKIKQRHNSSKDTRTGFQWPRYSNPAHNTDSSASVGPISRQRPAIAYRTVCRRKPHKIPCVIESVSGMRTIVTNAGSASSSDENSIRVTA